MSLFGNLKVYYSFSRFRKLFFLQLARLPMPGHVVRPLIIKWGGAIIKDYKKCYVGEDVHIDTIAPERIYIGENCTITTGTIILTHYKDTQTGKWFRGDVFIGDNTFIGANTIFTKSVKIGDNVTIGAGSIVTKDIPSNEIWAGNPAHFIKSKEVK